MFHFVSLKKIMFHYVATIEDLEGVIKKNIFVFFWFFHMKLGTPKTIFFN